MHIYSIILFAVIVTALILVDLFVVGRKSHEITTKEAGIWTLIFVGVSCAFGLYLHQAEGAKMSSEFFSAYVIEKVLSVDNLFVFIMVFQYFNVPKAYHHKVLFWGVLGAIVLRAVFIFAGVQVVHLLEISYGGHKYNLLIFLFGLFLAYTGIKSAIGLIGEQEEEEDTDYSTSPGAKAIKWIFGGNVSDNYDGDKFFTKVYGPTKSIGETPYIRYITPLLIVVGVIEFTDLLFAVDSIPAIFSVSNDPVVLYTSNIFAILGLRSMYFLLSNMLPLFTFLNHGLALILTFIGAKMIMSPFVEIDSNLSLFIVLGILTLSVIVSLLNPKENV